MKIVIAGATGFIGRQLTSSLLEQGSSVVVLTRNPGNTQAAHPALKFALWDGENAGSWNQYLDGADAIINLSGQSIGARRWTVRRKLELQASRVNSTNALVDAMKNCRTRPRVFLNASAVGYYGNVETGDVTEEHPAGNDFLGGLCLNWESTALTAIDLGVRVVLLRSGIVLDPKAGALQRMLLPYRLFVGGPLGSGQQWLPWIHREDEVRAILFALEREQISGPVNLAAPEPVTMLRFSRVLGKALHRPSFFPVPSFVLRTVLGEMADIVLTGQRVIPKKLLEAGFEFRFPALTAALADLLR
jgi:uncharacterized protein (TIGR01777 family)